MKILISGGTGLVGRYLVEELGKAGHDIVVGGRTEAKPEIFMPSVAFTPLSLDPGIDQSTVFDGIDVFIHAAFDHIPGRYRGGEGDDPQRFRHLNLDGTLALFEAAKRKSVHHGVFLSSRAVYGDHPPGVILREDMPAQPNTLYGQVKLEAEQALSRFAGPDFTVTVLRSTGVYGDLRPNKWEELIANYLKGGQTQFRSGTEVHGRDLASAIQFCLKPRDGTQAFSVYNVSDLLLGTQDVLAIAKSETKCPHALTGPVDASVFNPMDTTRLRALGWKPGACGLFDRTVRKLARDIAADLA